MPGNLEDMATKVLRICLKGPSPPAYACSIKLTGVFSRMLQFLRLRGYGNFTMLVKSALFLLVYLIERAEDGTPVVIGHNGDLPENTPLLTALGIGPESIYKKSAAINKAWNRG